MPFGEQVRIASPTGAILNLYFRQAEGPPRGVVQINHGLAEHAGRYARFAAFLAQQGYHSYAHDHRGHGLTTAPDAPPGRFAGHQGSDAVLDDVGAVHAAIRTDHPELPVTIFGHSMGGLIAMNYLLRHPQGVQGAAIWNADFSAGIAARAARALLAWERIRLGSDVPSRLMPRLTLHAWDRKISGNETPSRWLSRDGEEVRKFNEDPLCGRDISVSLWLDVLDFIFNGAADRNFAGVPHNMPINLVGGADDPATSGGKAVKHLADRLERMGFSNLNSTIYARTRHESLNELNRDMIMGDFTQWLDDAVARRSAQS